MEETARHAGHVDIVRQLIKLGSSIARGAGGVRSPSGSPGASTERSLADRVSLGGSRGCIAKGGAMGSTRKLYRSRTDRKLAGVCGGLAQYFNTDATLIRVLFVVLAVLGGSGLVIYLAMWIIVPSEP